jgi:hypothetical protein
MNQPHIEPGYILNFVRNRRDIRIRKWFPEPDTRKSYCTVLRGVSDPAEFLLRVVKA